VGRWKKNASDSGSAFSNNGLKNATGFEFSIFLTAILIKSGCPRATSSTTWHLLAAELKRLALQESQSSTRIDQVDD
jgi:hypothetical protein